MELIVTLLFLLVISSGSVFACTYSHRKYEEIVPITCTAMVLLSFLLGMIGLLKYSTLVIVIIAVILYVLSVFKIAKEKSLKTLLSRLITPGFVLFIILSFAFLFAIYGKLFDTWDEFSHWGDVVKAMTTIDDFATNHYSRSIFKTYPPGMSLFQYFIEKLNYYITGNIFSEWQCYYAYYVLAVAYLAPLTREFSFKKPLVMFTYLVATMCVPFTFYYGVYYQLYIDPFLSFLIAAGALELLQANNDITSDLRIYCISFMLVLAKDTGLLFAILLIVSFVVKRFSVKTLIFGTLSIAIPKLLWDYDCKINNATNQFSNSIDFKNLLDVILGRDNTYKTYVFNKYFEQFSIQGIKIGTIGININYLILSIVILALIVFVIYLLKKQYKNVTASVIYLLSSLIIFVLGLCVIYMYKFSEYEAKVLASYDRYLNIVYLGAWMFFAYALLLKINTLNKYTYSIIMICILCLVAPLLNIVAPYCLRSTVRSSKIVRQPYNELINKTNEICDGDDSVWIVVQDSTGFERLIYKYAIRPNFARNYYWILGEVNEGYEEYTLDITVEEWKQMLIEDYEYVALYNINDEFLNKFSSIFEDANSIKENCIYKVNKEKGTLTLCN